MIIEHLGKTLNSVSFDGELEPEKIKIIKDNYYNEDKEQALIQLEKVLTGGVRLLVKFMLTILKG